MQRRHPMQHTSASEFHSVILFLVRLYILHICTMKPLPTSPSPGGEVRGQDKVVSASRQSRAGLDTEEGQNILETENKGHSLEMHGTSKVMSQDYMIGHRMSEQEEKHTSARQKGCFLPYLLLSLLRPVQGSSMSGQCRAEQQHSILRSMTHCGPQSGLVQLREVLAASNMTEVLGLGMEEVVQVLPDVIRVDRCGGGCHLPQHSCTPTKVEQVEVEVMLVLARWPQGEHQVLCTTLQVEEHSSCGCGCKVQPHHCSSKQTYHHANCR